MDGFRMDGCTLKVSEEVCLRQSAKAGGRAR